MNEGNFTSNQQSDNQQPASQKQRNRRTVAMAAAFLAVALVFSAGTAAVVTRLLQQPASLSSAATEPVATTAVTDSAPSAQRTTGSQTTDKFYSIAEAAARQDPNKQTLSVVEIAARAKPAVVAVNTELSITNPFGQTSAAAAAGSGFIISTDGYIVTNAHVIDGASKISVVLDSGATYQATLVGADSQDDLAVLKIDGKNLPTVSLGDSASLQVGELAVAIGNPLGELSGTVTVGIISALDRAVTIDNQSLTLLQTDAAINAGNSGGALLNSFGEVIGINTAKNAGTGIEGLGFAIPIDHAKPIIEGLIKDGYITGRPRIGIYTQDVTAVIAQQNQLHEGIYVAQVSAGGAAEKAGIQAGDVIVAANGRETLTTEALNTLKASLKPGDILELTLYRQSQKMTVKVILEEDIPTDT